MVKLFSATFISLALSMVPVVAHADAAGSLRNANSMCSWLDSTKLFSRPCGVNLKGTSVDVSMETSKSEAGGVCKTITSKMKEDGVKFDKGWRLRIADSRQGNSKIAECSL